MSASRIAPVAAARPAVLANMCNAVRTNVISVQTAVHQTAVLLSLPHACWRARMLEFDGSPPTIADDAGFALLLQLAEARWHGDVAAFLQQARTHSKWAAQGQLAEHFPSGARIGWKPSLNQEQVAQYRLCAQLWLTVEILARTTSGLFLPRRAPDYSWERLFSAPFALHDTKVRRCRFFPFVEAMRSGRRPLDRRSTPDPAAARTPTALPAPVESTPPVSSAREQFSARRVLVFLATVCLDLLSPFLLLAVFVGGLWLLSFLFC
ncbi:MAG: hypothetical protein EXS13_12065 [Planctomycetes bacterium]|nr:hypothetical protein [Planctomycetota bacterium]